MQIDTSKLKNFLNLDDEEFKKKLSEAAKAGGVDDKVSPMLNDVKNIKKTLGNLNEQDIVNAINAFGNDKLETLVKNIQNNK